MKKIMTHFLLMCLGLGCAATTSSAQMYTLTDLVQANDARCPAPNSGVYYPTGINGLGEVVGTCKFGHFPYYAFRTGPDQPINPATDDLGALSSGAYSEANGINLFGQAVGSSPNGAAWHAFRTAPNGRINSSTDDLGTLGGTWSWSYGINILGQAVGLAYTGGDVAYHAFRTLPGRPINSATDDVGTLGGTYSQATGINDLGQVIGYANLAGDSVYHAFRTGPDRSINPATDDLGTFGGTWSRALGINLLGVTVGWANLPGDASYHAFRAAPNRPINPATDDLGTFGGSTSQATGINVFGEVVGWAALSGDASSHAFLYSGNAMRDLNNLIPPGSGCELNIASSITDAGQIAGNAICNGQSHAVLLTPIYKALPQSPLSGDGISVLSTPQPIVPLRFTLTRNHAPTCTLPPATITIAKAAGDSLVPVDLSDGDFRVDSTGCQYVYKLAAASLGDGTYLLEINIDGIRVGQAAFRIQ